MGSYDVSCGITRLSIHCGDDCVLLPLISPRVLNQKKFKLERLGYSKIKPTSMILYTYDIWEPFCLPIRGKYNDYGSLEEIIKDKNTEIIENYFGIPIEDFVAIITDVRRDVYDTYSALYPIFFDYRDDMGWDVPFETLLLHCGFEKNEENNNYSLDDCVITIAEDGKKAVMKIGDDSWDLDISYNKEGFLKEYRNQTGHYLGVSKDKIEKLELLNCVGGMFILGEAYDFYALNKLGKMNICKDFDVTKFFLEDNGFVPNDDYSIYTKVVKGKTLTAKMGYGGVESLNDKRCYSVKDFCKTYKKETDEKIDLSKYKGLDSEDWNVVEFERTFRKVLSNSKKISRLFDDEKNINLDSDEVYDKFINENFSILSFYCENEIYKYEWFKKFESLRQIYMKDVLKFNVLDKMSEFFRLMRAISLSNILLMPTYCGTQCGCTEAEMKLSLITNRIIEKRVETYKEEWEDFEMPDLEHGFDEKFY